jgi:hypothetical protein
MKNRNRGHPLKGASRADLTPFLSSISRTEDIVGKRLGEDKTSKDKFDLLNPLIKL